MSEIQDNQKFDIAYIKVHLWVQEKAPSQKES